MFKLPPEMQAEFEAFIAENPPKDKTPEEQAEHVSDNMFGTYARVYQNDIAELKQAVKAVETAKGITND